MKSILKQLSRNTELKSSLDDLDPVSSEDAKAILKKSKLFDTEFYLQAPDLKNSGIDAVSHYVDHGWQENRWPRPDFDPEYYTNSYRVDSHGENPFLHFLIHGSANELPILDPKEHYYKNAIATIKLSGLFDSQYYMSSPDLIDSGLEPISHYVKYGWREGRWPRKDFDPAYYRITTADIESNDDPFYHFITSDSDRELPIVDQRSEDYKIAYNIILKSNLFDSDFYRRKYKISDDSIDCLMHYLKKGSRLGLMPRIDFDPVYYAQNHLESKDPTRAFEHYVSVGVKENFKGVSDEKLEKETYIEIIHNSGLFESEFYLSHPDLAGTGIDPIEHYVFHGCHENRWPREDFDPVFYRAKYSLSVVDENPFIHFLKNGSIDDLPIIDVSSAIRKEQEKLIAQSGLFDESYYRTITNISDSSFNCIEHYLFWGVRQNLRPRKDFDPTYYAEMLTDNHAEVEKLLERELEVDVQSAFPIFVEINSILPLATVHPLEVKYNSEKDCIEESGLFDTKHYLSSPDLFGSGIDAIEHYVKYGHRENRWPRADFDPVFYRKQNKLSDTEKNVFIHFLEQGNVNELPYIDPEQEKIEENYKLIVDSGLFDSEFYKVSLNIIESDFDCIDHYLRWGAKQGLMPRKDFSAKFYVRSFAEQNLSEIPEANFENAFVHYIKFGREHSVSTIDEQTIRIYREIDTIKDSGLFDKDHYLLSDDLIGSGIDPVEHFVKYGWREHRDPRADFEVGYYLRINNLVGKNINPLVHFIEQTTLKLPQTDPNAGYIQEGIRTISESKQFDEVYYRKKLQIFDENFDGIDHFLKWGAEQGLRPRKDFDPSYYLAQYKEFRENSRIEAMLPEESEKYAFQHYLLHGVKYDLDCIDPNEQIILDTIDELAQSGLFDTKHYLDSGDLANSGIEPIEHYVKYGYREDRWPRSDFDPGYFRKLHNIHNNENPFLFFVRNFDSSDLPIRDPQEEEKKRAYKLIKNSGLFDETYYRRTVQVFDRNFDPIDHFINWGASQGLQPSKSFSPIFYAASEGVDVSSAFHHYIERGAPETVATIDLEEINILERIEIIKESTLFDSDYYMEADDLKSKNIDAIDHYVRYGCRENRWPRPDFDPVFYRKLNSKLLSSDNEFEHFIINGSLDSLPIIDPEAEQRKIDYQVIKSSGMFDEQYYRDVIKVDDKNFDCIEHYLVWGRKQGLFPSPDFDPSFYQNHYDDYDRRLVDPFSHYIEIGLSENRMTKTPVTQINVNADDPSQPSDLFEYARPSTSQSIIKTVAFYLPQYHPIPENDEWWGKGFTEWSNVSRGRPFYEGHQQPRLPADLGFYDLRLKDNIQAQVDLAKKFQIEAFCYHYYWFDGKRLLERPIDLFLENKDIDFKFCLNWANENWSRRWDGSENHILMAQNHSQEDDYAIADDLSKYLEDDRYLRVDGKPLFLVYRPLLLPDASETLDRWREKFIKNGIGEVVFGACLTFDFDSPKEHGFDFGVEFPPHNRTNLKHVKEDIKLSEDYSGNMITYDSYADDAISNEIPCDTQLFRGVMPSWDNTARRGKASTIFHGSTPNKFQKVTHEVVSETVRKNKENKENLLFVNAWNEWAESAVLEPDKTFGHAYLNAVNRAITGKLCNSLLVITRSPEVQSLDAIDSVSSIEVLQMKGAISLSNVLMENLEDLKRFDLLIYIDTVDSQSEQLIARLVEKHYVNAQHGCYLHTNECVQSDNELTRKDKDVLTIAGTPANRSDLIQLNMNDTKLLSFKSDSLYRSFEKLKLNIEAGDRDFDQMDRLLVRLACAESLVAEEI